MNPEISIIVPVYNVESVLHRCLESIINQTFINFECVLVDDCSPDNCGAICDEYAIKDSRFKVIHKSRNEGLPKARKSGLDIAKGKFVLHADSDDWLELKALELLYNKQQEMDADIVVGRYKEIYDNSEKIAVSRYENKFDNLLVNFFMNRNTSVVWGKLYKKTLFDPCIVPPLNIGEDVFTNIQILSNNKNIKIIKTNYHVCNYDRRTGMTYAKKTNTYNTIEESERYKMLKIIEKYLEPQFLKNENIKSAYLYSLFVSAIIPYLRSNPNASYCEIKDFYKNCYMRCEYRNLAPLYMKASISFLYYLGRFKWAVLLHFWVMNFAKAYKYRFVLKA